MGRAIGSTKSSLGVDVGGTFTDIVFWDGGDITVGKVPTTLHDQSEGVMNSARGIVPLEGTVDLLHGTTVATNALLERRGARTLLVTDAGFESLIEIARQNRPSLYDPFVDRPFPLAPSELRLGVDISEAATAVELDEIVDDIVAMIAEHQAEAVAVCLLDSYVDPSQENRLSRRLRERLLDDCGTGKSKRSTGFTVPVSASAEVVAEFREYERFSTTVMNAFLSPEVKRYVNNLAERAKAAGFVDKIAVMRSSGGLISLTHTADFPTAILLSGPAGGVIASAALGERMGCDALISFDMGGTSTDVCRVFEGRPQLVYNREIAGYASLMPSVAVHTVGAGGGSIAWADSGGALRVGPRSAGATPGPACYDEGGVEPTVTDADLLLGRLHPSADLAGAVSLNYALAFSVCKQLGEKLSLGPVDTALGVLSVVESHMAHAIRSVSVEQGTDPRDATLVAFGGAGGLHATALAKSLDMRQVIIPPYAGVFSAFGLLLSAPRVDLAQTVNLEDSEWNFLPVIAERLIAEGCERIKSDSGRGARTVELVVDMRYAGQAHETSVMYELGESWHDLRDKFHFQHAQRNGFALTDEPVEIVTVRAEVVGVAPLEWSELPDFTPERHSSPKLAKRTVVSSSGPVEAEVWWRPALPPGTNIEGPAIIEEGESTAYIAAGEQAVVHEAGALMISW
ncbi:MAG: hydantoinase/oxoprolinase family protein [Acidimicrobiaceae bacterium]|nr:hydantoinase/oxoprolinase family protein [Acidimicrobiaceae bacterium]